MRHRLVAGADFEAGRAAIHQKGGDAAGPGGDEDDQEIGDVGVADEMLVPFSSQSPPSRRALHFMPRTSDPASGSVIASASIFSPRTAGSR